jgi:hypothetical protein
MLPGCTASAAGLLPQHTSSVLLLNQGDPVKRFLIYLIDQFLQARRAMHHQHAAAVAAVLAVLAGAENIPRLLCCCHHSIQIKQSYC